MEQARSVKLEANFGRLAYSKTADDEGKVIAQAPEAGIQVNSGAKVTLTLSKGSDPAIVQVPGLVGQALAGAQQAAAAAGLQGVAQQFTADDQAAGTVIAEEPPAETWVKQGAEVRLTVSTGQ